MKTSKKNHPLDKFGRAYMAAKKFIKAYGGGIEICGGKRASDQIFLRASPRVNVNLPVEMDGILVISAVA